MPDGRAEADRLESKGEADMYPVYEETSTQIHVVCKDSRHVRPHLHRALEMVYVTEGTLELGVGKELYHMEKGDLGIVFPDMIHHCQVFSEGINRACHILAEPSVCGAFKDELFRRCPREPVIPREALAEDAVYAVGRLMELGRDEAAVGQAYIQVLLARSMPCLALMEKAQQEEGDLVYQMVVYMAAHFREHVTLSMAARDLGVSKYTLSRLFSGIFHRNFNRYLNELRLSCVCELLEYTDRTVTEICLEAGFDSQRTFHRVFRETCRMTPGEYRRKRRGTLWKTI